MSVESQLLCNKLRGHYIAVIDTKDEVYQNLFLSLSPSVKVVHFSDQNQALESIQQQPPNLILINTENISAAHIHFNGIEISQNIKLMEAYQFIQHIPVIIFGLGQSPADDYQFIISSADARISETFDCQLLLDALSKISVYKYVLEE